MSQLALPLDCVINPYMMGGYGGYRHDGYRDRNGDNALKAALHVQDHVSINNLRSDVNSGFHRVTDGQQQIVNSIFTAENDIRTDLDSVKNLQNQNSLHNLNATRESKDHITNAVNAGTMANLEATRNVGEDLSDEICDVGKDSLKSTHLLSKEIGENRFFTSQGFSNVRHELAKESCDTRQEILINRFENQKAEARTRELLLDKFAQTQLEACKNTNELQRQADQNFAKLQAQIAECCCENKLLTQQQSAETRELFLKQQLEDERRHNKHQEHSNLQIFIQNIVETSVRQAVGNHLK